VFRSIYIKVFVALLLLWLAEGVIHWGAQALAPPDHVRIVVLALTLAATILCATLFAWSISIRLRKLRLLEEALTRREAPLNIPDLGDDEIGDFARSLRDIAPEFRRLAEGLTAALAQREAILDGMIEGLLVVDHEMRVSFCNHAFARAISGRGVPQQGAPVLSVIRDPSLLDLVEHVIHSGKPASARSQISAAPGRSFQVRAAPLLTPAATGAVVLLLDTTEMERLERVRKDFVANVSHELRTPLAAIRGYAETLLDGALDDVENRRKFIEIILAHANRLNNIASDLLALSDLESGENPPTAPLSIAETVDTALQTVQAEAAIRGVQLIRGNVPDRLRARGNKTRLEQVLINLLDNAVKFNRAGGTVRVDAEGGENGVARVTVEDSGIGIPSTDLSRVFERFYRVDKGRSRQVGGTGLGLSIVKHAMEQMKGSVTVESTLGKGSRFTISLPIEMDQASTADPL
jgi:two-component system phosphate regulon sensor histidine kinase PhoR